MYCDSIEEGFKQISAYFKGKCTGYALVIDTENIKVYSEIIQRLVADKSKNCSYVSDSCRKNGLPNIEECISDISRVGDYVLIGGSQAMMLKSERDLEEYVDTVLGHAISGHALIVLYYCKRYIEKFEKRDPRITKRTIMFHVEESPLPQIALMKENVRNTSFEMKSIKHLLCYLEKMTEMQLNEHRVIPVNTNFDKKFFSKAMYQVVEAEGIYESLTKQYPEIAGATEKSYGTDEQWKWLDKKMQGKKSLSGVIYEEFGNTSNLEYMIRDIDCQKEPYKNWLCWLAMKSFGTSNCYLKKVLRNSKNENDFEEHIYLDLADENINAPNFENLYLERKNLLEYIPERLSFIARYCEKLGRYEKNAIYYLTDQSEAEEFEFIRCLCIYDYSEDELCIAAKHFSTALALYLDKFYFDNVNTKVADTDNDLREVLTQYFQEYKIQKVTNRIYSDFEDTVSKFAIDRPYNKLRPRSSIIAQLNKENAELFFFDALGVEYLSFIKAKCEEYDLIIEIAVGHCELPSITEKNKEFIQYFGGKYRKIDGLDELKHHSQIYDYEKRKEPIHIFRELEIIDAELRRIHSLLIQGAISKAIIASDHGASRLAVIYGRENGSILELDEKAQHSGRCCPTEINPNIPYVAYEDGFAVLANYERFRGGRKANVEVHGGATLEEVVVPVITISRKPENIEYCFTNPIIILKQKDVATLTLYCNVPMNKPRILVNRIFYDGEFVADQKHAKFVMPELKRSREYIAEIYDGDTGLSVSLKFKIQKSMGQEVDLLA